MLICYEPAGDHLIPTPRMTAEEVDLMLLDMGYRLKNPETYDARPGRLNEIIKLPKWWQFWRS